MLRKEPKRINLMVQNKTLHITEDNNKPHTIRKERDREQGVRGLVSIEEFVDWSVKELASYKKKSNENFNIKCRICRQLKTLKRGDRHYKKSDDRSI